MSSPRLAIPGFVWDVWMVITVVILSVKRCFNTPSLPWQLAISKKRPTSGR
jgi:ABC-type maltose transport system permease subunit